MAQSHSIANALLNLLKMIISEGTFIPKMYLPVIEKMAADYLSKADESELRKMIVQLRDEIIPAVLGESNPVHNDSK